MNQKLNNTIEESFCSFEVSKLLKEKGFNNFSHGMYYDKEGKYYPGFSSNMSDYEDKIHRPNHSLAIEWVRINFEIEIFILPIFREKCGYDSFRRDGFSFEIIKHNPCQYLDFAMFNKCGEDRDELEKDEVTIAKTYKNPQEAIETALLYVLKNMIK